MQPDIRNDLTYFLRIPESIQKIILYSKDYDDVIDFFFANDQKDFNASLMLFINIGEQSTKIENSLKEKYSNISWTLIKDFRNRVAHDYAGLDTFKVFEIIKEFLPGLKTSVETIVKNELKEGTFSLEEFDIAKQSKYYKNIDFSKLVF